MSIYDTVTVDCTGCGKQVTIPSGKHQLAIRNGKQRPIFCTKKCNQLFVAREGAKAQERLASGSGDHRPDNG